VKFKSQKYIAVDVLVKAYPKVHSHADTILVKPRSEHEYRRHFFSQRVVDEWNPHPDYVKEARNVPCFKRLYRRTRLTASPA
jgi:hypothetical protein